MRLHFSEEYREAGNVRFGRATDDYVFRAPLVGVGSLMSEQRLRGDQHDILDVL